MKKRRKRPFRSFLAIILMISMAVSVFDGIAFAKEETKTGYQTEVVYNSDYTSAEVRAITTSMQGDVQIQKLVDADGVEYNANEPDITYTENGSYTYTLFYTLISETPAEGEEQNVYEEIVEITVDKIGYAKEVQERQEEKDEAIKEEQQEQGGEIKEEQQEQGGETKENQKEAAQADEPITSKEVTFIGRQVAHYDSLILLMQPAYPVEFLGTDAEEIKQFHEKGFASGDAATMLADKDVGKGFMDGPMYKPMDREWTDTYNIAGNGADKTYGVLTTRIDKVEYTVESMRQNSGKVYYKLKNEADEKEASKGQVFYINYYVDGWTAKATINTNAKILKLKDTTKLIVNGAEKDLDKSETEQLEGLASDGQYVRVTIHRPKKYFGKMNLRVVDTDTNKAIITEKEMRLFGEPESEEMSYEFKIPYQVKKITLQWRYDFEDGTVEDITSKDVTFIGRLIEEVTDGDSKDLVPMEFTGSEKEQIDKWVTEGLKSGNVESVVMKDKNIGAGGVAEYIPYVRKKGEQDKMGAITTMVNAKESVVKELWQIDGKIYYAVDPSDDSELSGVLIQAEKNQIFYMNYSLAQSNEGVPLLFPLKGLDSWDVKLEINGKTYDKTTSRITVKTSQYINIRLKHLPELKGSFDETYVVKGGPSSQDRLNVTITSTDLYTDFRFKIPSVTEMAKVTPYQCYVTWKGTYKNPKTFLLGVTDGNANLADSAGNQIRTEYDALGASTGEGGEGTALSGSLGGHAYSQYVGTTRMTIKEGGTNNDTNSVFISDFNSGRVFVSSDVSYLGKLKYRMETKDSVVYGGKHGTELDDGVSYAKDATADLANQEKDKRGVSIGSYANAGSIILRERIAGVEAGTLSGSGVTVKNEQIVPFSSPSHMDEVNYVNRDTVLSSSKFQSYQVRMNKGSFDINSESAVVSSPENPYKGENYYAFTTPEWNQGSQSGKYPTALSSFTPEDKKGNLTVEYDFQWGTIPWHGEWTMGAWTNINEAHKPLQEYLVGNATTDYSQIPPGYIKVETWTKDKSMIKANSDGSKFTYDAPSRTEYVDLWGDAELHKLDNQVTKTLQNGTKLLITLKKAEEQAIGTKGTRYIFEVQVQDASSDIRLTFTSRTDSQPSTQVSIASVSDGLEIGNILKKGNVTVSGTDVDLRKTDAGGGGMATVKEGGYNTGKYDTISRGGKPLFKGGKEPAEGQNGGAANYYRIPVWVKKGYYNPIPELISTLNPGEPMLEPYWKDNPFIYENGYQGYKERVTGDGEKSQDVLRLAYTRVGTKDDAGHEGDMLYMYYLNTDTGVKPDDVFRKLTFSASRLKINVAFRDSALPNDYGYIEEKANLDWDVTPRITVPTTVPTQITDEGREDIFLGWKIAFYEQNERKDRRSINLHDENGEAVNKGEAGSKYNLQPAEYLPDGELYQPGDLIDLKQLYSAYNYALARYYTENIKVADTLTIHFIPVFHSGINSSEFMHGEIQFKYQTLNDDYDAGSAAAGEDRALYRYDRIVGDKETKLVPVDGNIYSFPTNLNAVKMPRIKSRTEEGGKVNLEYYKVPPYYMYNDKESTTMANIASPVPNTEVDGDVGSEDHLSKYLVVGEHVYDRAYKTNFNYTDFNTVFQAIDDFKDIDWTKPVNQISDDENTIVSGNNSILKLPKTYTEEMNKRVGGWEVEVRRQSETGIYQAYRIRLDGFSAEQASDGGYELDLSKLTSGTVMTVYSADQSKLYQESEAVKDVRADLLKSIIGDSEHPVMELRFSPVAQENKKIEYVKKQGEQILFKDTLLVSDMIGAESFSSNIYQTDGKAYRGLEVGRMYFRFEGEDTIPDDMKTLESRKKFKVVWEKRTTDGTTHVLNPTNWLTNLATKDGDKVSVFYDEELDLFWTPLIVKESEAIMTDGKFDLTKLQNICRGWFRSYISYDNEEADKDTGNAQLADDDIYQKSDELVIKTVTGVEGVATIPASITLTEQTENGKIVATSKEMTVTTQKRYHSASYADDDKDSEGDTNWNIPQASAKDPKEDYITSGNTIYKDNLPFILNGDGMVSLYSNGFSPIEAKAYQKQASGDTDVSQSGLKGNVVYGTDGSITDIFTFYLKTERPKSVKNGTVFQGIMHFRLSTSQKTTQKASERTTVANVD